MSRETSTSPKKPSLKTYKKIKLKMLKNDFQFRLTAEEICHLNELTTENDIDRYCHTLFMKYLD